MNDLAPSTASGGPPPPQAGEDSPARERWVPEREWAGERCFILAGGESLSRVRGLIPRLEGRVIAIKQTAAIRPEADIMFVAARDDPVICKDIFPLYRGPKDGSGRIVLRTAYDGFPEGTLFMRRAKDHESLCREAGVLGGYDAGSSSLNLAFHLGVTEIVLIGFDMAGGRWLNGEMKHPLPIPPQQHHDRHLAGVTKMAEGLAAEGVKVWRTAKESRAVCFEYRKLEAFL